MNTKRLATYIVLFSCVVSCLLHQPPVIDNDANRTIRGMNSNGNRSTPVKPVPVPLFQQQIPYDVIRARNWVFAVESQRITA
jgi:hypothetical protein